MIRTYKINILDFHRSTFAKFIAINKNTNITYSSVEGFVNFQLHIFEILQNCNKTFMNILNFKTRPHKVHQTRCTALTIMAVTLRYLSEKRYK